MKLLYKVLNAYSIFLYVFHFEQVLFGISNYNINLRDYISIFSMIIYYTKLLVFAYFIYYQVFYF